MKQSKRKIVSWLLAAALLMSLVPAVALAEGSTGTATVRLVVQKDWGDNSGYILLMDADADTYGNQMGSNGAVSNYREDVDPAVMALFESKLPTNADGKKNGDNMLRCGESASMEVPAGTYDWTLLNPTPDTSDYGGSIYVAPNGFGDDLEIKARHIYTFTVQDLGDSGDRVVLHIEEQERIEITRVDVTLTEPVVGAMPQNSITIHTDGVVDGQTIPVQWLRLVDGASVTQYDDGTLVSEEPFRAGVTYVMGITMDTEADYAFAEDVQVYWNEQLAPALGSAPATGAGFLPQSTMLAFAYVGQAEIAYYAITFDPNGGAVTPQQDTTGEDGKLAALPTPTHSDRDLEFKGWYTEKEGGDAVTTDTVFTQDATVYAQWKEKIHLTPPTGDGNATGLYLALALLSALALAYVGRKGAVRAK